ncbi:hypothetical protein BH18THE1_BH18THE1_00910 [soil metagenome]
MYISGINEEFIATQLDLEIPVVISILKEFGVIPQRTKKIYLDLSLKGYYIRYSVSDPKLMKQNNLK